MATEHMQLDNASVQKTADLVNVQANCRPTQAVSVGLITCFECGHNTGSISVLLSWNKYSIIWQFVVA